LVCPLEGALQNAALLNILMECWPPARRSYGSERVMEYWKNENPTPIFCNFTQRSSRFSDALSSQAIDHHASIPILHYALKLLQAEPNISDPAKRTTISKFDLIKEQCTAVEPSFVNRSSSFFIPKNQ
jgi:hypothetical protein